MKSTQVGVGHIYNGPKLSVKHVYSDDYECYYVTLFHDGVAVADGITFDYPGGVSLIDQVFDAKKKSYILNARERELILKSSKALDAKRLAEWWGNRGSWAGMAQHSGVLQEAKCAFR